MDTDLGPGLLLVAFGAVLGPVLSFASQLGADFLRERRTDRKATRERKAAVEEADRQRRAEAKDADQVEALTAAAARSSALLDLVAPLLEFYERDPGGSDPSSWWPPIRDRLADVRHGWEREWRYVIFGAGRIGFHFADLHERGAQLEEAVRGHDPDQGSDDLREALSRLSESANALHEAVQLGRHTLPEWRD